MPADVEIRIADDLDAESRRELEDRLNALNVERTGYDDYRPASCVLRDDGGRVLAGIDGFTWGDAAFLGTLWVDAELRGRGLGRRLVQAFEDEARRRGCAVVVLASFDFQAPGFYESLGYEIVASTEDTPRGHREHHLRKRLTGS